MTQTALVPTQANERKGTRSRDPEVQWLCQQLGKLTTRVEILLPSEWTEKKRYLPASMSPMPGYFRFNVTPYSREIIDCMSPESDVRHVSVMKGVQVGMTSLLESTIGFYIDAVKTAPMLLVTADAEMAKLRMDGYVVPMLTHSGLDHLVHSLDEQNTRKTGRTDKLYSWEGGGSLIPIGAVNANKMRSVSVSVLLRDEVDSWADNVGKDGDPIKLTADRTAAFEASRKIFDVSTPLIKGSSKIARLFEAGDQRYFNVKCLECNHPQVLRWSRTDADTGRRTGMVWETEDNRLVPGSVHYLCEVCSHPHTNDDKPALFATGVWVPTAVPQTPHHRSYHLSALYSSMASWESCAVRWLEAWDVANSRPKDVAQLQTFYNSILGVPFEQQGQTLRFESVSSHRRHEYRYGQQVPNSFAIAHCGSPILLVTCSVDVHLDNLSVAVFGWTRGRRVFLLNYWIFKGNTENVDEPKTWGKLREVIEPRADGSNEYVGDDGRRYLISLTLIDCKFLTDTVHRFCEIYSAGVYPIRGSTTSSTTAPTKEFWSTVLPSGMPTWSCAVSLYKERWASALRRSWDGQGMQPEGHFNAPLDVTDAQLKQLCVETKREKIDKATGKSLGFVWYRPNGADNTLWDLLQYSSCALDIYGWDLCIRQMGRPSLDWDIVWSSLAA